MCTVHVAMEVTKRSYLSLNCNIAYSELNILSEQWGSSMVDDMFFIPIFILEFGLLPEMCKAVEDMEWL